MLQVIPFDSRTRTTTSTRFHLKFFRVLSKNIHPGILHCFFFSPDKLELLSLLKEVKTSSDCKMLKLLTFDNLFSPLRHSR